MNQKDPNIPFNLGWALPKTGSQKVKNLSPIGFQLKNYILSSLTNKKPNVQETSETRKSCFILNTAKKEPAFLFLPTWNLKQ